MSGKYMYIMVTCFLLRNIFSKYEHNIYVVIYGNSVNKCFLIVNIMAEYATMLVVVESPLCEFSTIVF
jgi:hypothetical protein